MIGIERLYTLDMDQGQLLTLKIHSNFNSSDKITKFFANPISSIDAPLQILFCLTLLQIMSKIAYSVGYRWFYLKFCACGMAMLGQGPALDQDQTLVRLS